MKDLQDIKPLLLAHYHACLAEDWDEAAKAISEAYKYLHHWGYFELITDLYGMLVPSGWRNGKQLVTSPHDHADILSCLGIAYYYIGQFTTANDYLQQSLSTARRIGDRKTEATALSYAALNHQFIENKQIAIENLRECLAIATEIQDYNIEYLALDNLGCIYASRGNYHLAIEYISQALEVARQNNLFQKEFYILGNLGATYVMIKDYASATSTLKQMLATYNKINLILPQRYILSDISNTYTGIRNHLAVIELVKNSLKTQTNLVDTHPNKNLEKNILLTTFNGLEEYQDFFHYLSEVLKLDREMASAHVQVMSLYNLGLSYQKIGQFEQEIEKIQNDWNIFHEIQSLGDCITSIAPQELDCSETKELVELAKVLLKTRIVFQKTQENYLNQAEKTCMDLQLPLLKEIQQLKADLQMN